MSKTPIHKARNLGPICEAELLSIGIDSVEALRQLGWEEVCCRWSAAYPTRINLNAFASIIGAIEEKDWRRIDRLQKEAAKRFIRELKMVGH